MTSKTRIATVDGDTRRRVASTGGAQRAANLTAEQRSEIARQGAAKANSAAALAMRLRRMWAGVKPSERAEVAETLTGCNGLVSRMLKITDQVPS